MPPNADVHDADVYGDRAAAADHDSYAGQIVNDDDSRQMVLDCWRPYRASVRSSRSVDGRSVHQSSMMSSSSSCPSMTVFGCAFEFPLSSLSAADSPVR